MPELWSTEKEDVMPDYDYECPECKQVYELYHSMKAELTVKCPVCKVEMERLIGKIEAVHVKGSNFVGGREEKPQEKVYKTRDFERDGFLDTVDLGEFGSDD